MVSVADTRVNREVERLSTQRRGAENAEEAQRKARKERAAFMVSLTSQVVRFY
jgi:50S ribosomal subunit-associated GTPase HflX